MEDTEDREATEKFIQSLPYKIPTYKHWTSRADFYHPLKAGSIDGTDLIPHDHGIVRATRASYKPNKKVVGNPANTVMVRHLSRDTSEAVISGKFSKYGPLEKCRLIRDIVTGVSRGYAFVEFKYERDALRALHDTNNITIDGCNVVVDLEVERTLQGWIPRRFGGGFGGKKESGQLRFGGIERPFRRPIPVDSVYLGSKPKQFGQSRNVNNKREHDSRSRLGNKRHCR